jgi:hypothetical protein
MRKIHTPVSVWDKRSDDGKEQQTSFLPPQEMCDTNDYVRVKISREQCQSGVPFDKDVFVFVLFRDGFRLCSQGWPGTHHPPASASRVLGLQVGTTTPV